jgi:hypothetical protein
LDVLFAFFAGAFLTAALTLFLADFFTFLAGRLAAFFAVFFAFLAGTFLAVFALDAFFFLVAPALADAPVFFFLFAAMSLTP